MPTTVDTTTDNAGLNPNAYAVTSGGVRWLVYENANGTVELSYEAGSGWTSLAGTFSGTDPNLFIDEDDYAHLVMVASGVIQYRRGTPNGNDWTWDGPHTLNAGGTEHNPRVVAHSEGTGWKAHVVWGMKDSDSQGTWYYRRNCNHSSAGGHSHSQTCGPWGTSSNPPGCTSFGTHSHYAADITCGPTCEPWPDNGDPRNCQYEQLTNHTHSPIDAGVTSHWEESGTTYDNRVYYGRINITGAEVVSVEVSNTLLGSQSDYDESHPFIDFCHTGDGKTPKLSPHLFVGWQNRNGETYVRRGTYSAGNWSWVSQDTVATSQSQGYAIGGYNGNDFIIIHRDQSSTTLLLAWKVSDSGTVTSLGTIPSLSNALECYAVSLVSDTIFLFAADSTSGDLHYTTYTGTWAAWETIETATITNAARFNNMAAELHAIGGGVDVFYLDGSGSPYNINLTELVYLGTGGGLEFLPIGGDIEP